MLREFLFSIKQGDAFKETLFFNQTTNILVQKFSDGSGSKNFDPGWVGSAIYGLGLENFA